MPLGWLRLYNNIYSITLYTVNTVLSDKPRVYNVHFCVFHILIFPVSIFLFSFTHFLSTAKSPPLFPILQFSRDQMYEKIHHCCFCCMSALLGATLPLFSVLWLQSGLVVLHVCCADVAREFLFTIPSSLSCVASSVSWIPYHPFSLFISLFQ